jgi:hypothetical protein
VYQTFTEQNDTLSQLFTRLEQVEFVAASTTEEMGRLQRALVLSTQDDGECGKRVLAGNDLQLHVLEIPLLESEVVLSAEHLTAYDQSFGLGTNEDDAVNKPLQSLLSCFLLPGSCKFTDTSSPVKDHLGRTHKPDLNCCDGRQLTVTTLSVALEGKLSLIDMSQRDTMVGQAVRRGKLLIQLQAGSGREFPVVAFYDYVGFLKLDQKYKVFFSKPEPMLGKEAGMSRALPGFQKLLRVIGVNPKFGQTRNWGRLGQTRDWGTSTNLRMG